MMRRVVFLTAVLMLVTGGVAACGGGGDGPPPPPPPPTKVTLDDKQGANQVYLRKVDYDRKQERVVLGVFADQVQADVFAIAYDLSFDPAVLRFVSAAAGDFITDGLQIVDTPRGLTGVVRAGVSHVGDGLGSNQSSSGSGYLHSLIFEVRKVGKSDLTFSRVAALSRPNVAEPLVESSPPVPFADTTLYVDR